MQTPQSNLLRITTVMKAWENLRPEKSFGGLTLDEYKRIVQPSLDSRARIEQLEPMLAAERAQRDAEDGGPGCRRCVRESTGASAIAENHPPSPALVWGLAFLRVEFQ
jgi:hypothetical protein